jgi:hypothetical protein
VATSVSSPRRAGRTPTHLWIVGGVSLLWNAFGAFDYLMTQFRVEAYMGEYTPEQLEYFYRFPPWMTAASAVGVWFAVAGSAALLLHSRWAVHLFGVSLLGLAVTTVYTNILTDGMAAMGGDIVYVIFSIAIWLVLIGLLGFIEPCSIGSSLLFTSTSRARRPPPSSPKCSSSP